MGYSIGIVRLRMGPPQSSHLPGFDSAVTTVPQLKHSYAESASGS